MPQLVTDSNGPGQMLIKLASGASLTVDSFYVEQTYAGLLAGLPTAHMNTEILLRAQTLMTPLWGKRPTYVIPPVSRQERGHTIFPHLTYFAWLTSYEPIDPAFMASELVVVWFAPEQADTPLSEIVSNAVRDISWASLARDFSW